ncbi:MAG TPA: hypothetical protein VIE44_06250 [Methylomirabilota bacterium]|jgi:hypothetical protein
MRFVEERDFTLRFDLRCTFEEGYDGELDGYAWLREFQDRIVPGLIESVVRTVRAHPGWTVRPGNRGRAIEDEVTLVVERVID